MKTRAPSVILVSRVIHAGFGLALFSLLPGIAVAAVDATVTPNSTSTQAITPVVLNVTGLSVGQSIVVERIADANANGSVDAGEFVAQRFTVTEGQVTSIGGVRNTNVPGDDDTVANGQVSINLTPSAGPEIGRLAGAQLLRISSPTANFTTFTRTLTLTQPANAQSISGTVTDGTNPVPFASVILLDSTTDGEFVLGVIANASGQFTAAAPVGSYKIAALKIGFISSFDTAPTVVLGAGATPTQNLQIAPATTSMSGTIADADTSAGLGGVQLFAQSMSGAIVVCNSAADGTFSVPVSADQWQIEASELSLSELGYLSLNASGVADTTGGAATGVNINLTKASSLIHGTVTDSGANPLPGVRMSANAANSNNSGSNAITNANGQYVLGVGTGDWNVNVSDNNPSLAGYVIPSGQNFTITAATAVQADFAMLAVNAHLQGVVTNNGSPVSGIRIGAYKQNGNVFVTADTGVDGSFDLGVVDGDWSLELESQSAAAAGVIGPSLNYTLIANQTINGIAYAVITTTAQIVGNVREADLTPIPNANVFAAAFISGVNYVAHGQTDGSGNYSLPVIDGAWLVNANAQDYTPRDPVQVIVAGSNVTRNIILTKTPIFTTEPANQTVNAGQTLVFSVNVNSNSTVTLQWQVSVDSGTNWSDLSNDATYSNVTSSVLGVTANIGLNGYRYRCVATNSFGAAASIGAVLTVNVVNIAPSITLQPINQSVTATQSASFTVAASGTPTPTFQWQLSTDNGANWADIANDATYGGATTDTLAISATTLGQSGYRYRAVATNSQGAASSNSATLTVSPAVAPSIISNPVVQTAVVGAQVTFSVTASGSGPLAYQWKRNNVNIAGATDASYTISSLQSSQGGTYTVVVSNSAGSVTSGGAALTIDSTPRLINVSTRAFAGSGGSTLIMGFYIAGTGSKTVLIRGVGPKLLDLGVPVVVADPSLTVYSGDTPVAQNNDWDPSLGSSFTAMGAFPLDPGSKDAALTVTLTPGAYTVHLVNDGPVAEALVEVYDLSRDVGTRLVNLSCRLNINAGQNVILGTYMLNASKPILVRNSGPALTFNFPDALPLSVVLPDPRLTVFSGATSIAENDDWDSSLAPNFVAVGAFPFETGSKDAAVRQVLTPGGYTIHAAGNGSGIALIELYESP